LTPLSLLLISCYTLNKKTDFLRGKIAKIVWDKDAIIGVSIIGKNDNDTISLNGLKG
jgi:beta-lactamase class A/beta-lactamase class A VEB